MKYFKPAFLDFFKNLSANNSKEWFDANRKIYETEVKKPFQVFVEEMISRIQKHEPEVQIKAADAIMRINNDIRFSKDKTPYKTHMAANISVYGKKDKSYPGFYFQLSADKITVFGGAYMMETPVLNSLRNFIAQNHKAFKSVYSEKDFKEKFGRIQGEKNKKLSPELTESAKVEPLIFNRQFYYSAELPTSLILSEKLTDKLMEYYLAGAGLNDFLKTAF
jgi:uncharacterized protein (TIGR02453 family)